MAGVALPGLVCPTSRWAEAAVDEVVYRSPEVRIVRTLDRHGAPMLVLTNLDEEGNRMGGEPEEAACPPAGPAPDAPLPEPPPEGQAEPPREGVTVIVNINTPPVTPPEDDAADSPAYPVFGIPGVVGAFHYPHHLPFLGYSADGSSPSFFRGLGLRAGTRFGPGSGGTCGPGHGCRHRP